MAKRILIFSTTYFPLVGGAEVAMKEVTDRLIDYQFDLICARIQTGLADTEKMGNVTVHRCGFGKPIDKYLLPLFGVWRAHRLVSAKELTAVWSLMASYNGFAALAYAWLHPGVRFLLTLQEGDPLDHYDRRTGIFRFLHKAIFQRANVVHAISRFLGDWAKRMGFTGEPVIIPNGVDVERFSRKISLEKRQDVRRQLGYDDQDVVLITTSRLILKNAVDDLIQSLTYLPEYYKALIVGAGEDEEKLKKLMEEKGLISRVKFLGKKNHEELPDLLQASDIFVRASLSEGLGVSFIEAMAAGLPVIATPVGGIPEFLRESETGVFCQIRHPETVARAAKRIQEEPGLRATLIKNAQQLVHQGYEWKTIATSIQKLFSRT